MNPSGNRQVILVSRPVGLPKSSDFKIETAPVPEPAAGQVLVRNLWMSVDPYMRGRMSDRKSYAPSFQVGEPMEGRAVGQVVKSNHRQVKEGAAVSSMLGWREYFVAPAESVNLLDSSFPLSSYLGVLGIPGFTGWYGLTHIGRPKSGETLVVSGAAGATGSLVVQLGKILGCRVVGTAGSDDKCAYLTRELGADVAINYKKSEALLPSLREACPKGIDVYFENVGGPLLDMVLTLVNPFARIPLCGMISQYNLDPPDPGPRYLFSMIGNRVLMQGFIISDHLSLYPEFLAEVGGWLKSGRIKRDETVVEGIENAPKAFLGLFAGDNVGKMIVRLAPEAR